MKVVEVINVDFSVVSLPAATAARHPQPAVTMWSPIVAEGPLLADVRAEGFRVEAAPFVRRLSPRRPVAAPSAPSSALSAARKAGHRPRPHADQRFPRTAGRPGRWRATHRLHLPWFPIQPARAMDTPGRLVRHGNWWGGWFTDVFLTVSDEEAADARRLRISAQRAVSVRNGRDPAIFKLLTPEARASHPRTRSGYGAKPGRNRGGVPAGPP